MEKYNKALNLSEIKMSQEFLMPLNSCLVLLESLEMKNVDAAMRKIVLALISQINLLLYLVNDILDMKMID